SQHSQEPFAGTSRKVGHGLKRFNRRGMREGRSLGYRRHEGERWPLASRLTSFLTRRKSGSHRIRRPPRNFLIKTMTTMRSAKLSQVSLGYRLIASVTCAEWHAPRTFIGNRLDRPRPDVTATSS